MSAVRTRSKKSKKRTHRYTSNVFSMFNQAQIQEFKEAFNMIDQNGDGFIDKEDLIEMMTSLGKNPDDELLDNMINEAPGAINFTMFLTLFGEKLNGTDPDDVIRNAFGCFDAKTLGVLPQEHLRDIMTTMGDRWTDEMVDELFYGAPIKEGVFDYIEFTRLLKHGPGDKLEEKLDNAPPPTPSTPTTTTSSSKFAFQNQPPPPPSPSSESVPEVVPQQPPQKKAFWKKPKAKSPPPPSKARSPPPPQRRPKSPPPPPAHTKPVLPKTTPPASPVKPPTPGSKPDLPAGGKPQLPTLKTSLKVQPFQQLQSKMQQQQPPLKPVLKSTPKALPK